MTRIPTTHRDLVSLAKRAGYLQLFRFGLVAVVLITAGVTPDVVGTSLGAIAPISLCYAILSAAAEALRRAGGHRQLGAVSLMLIVDGVYLGWVLQLTGVIDSPLRFLVFAHIVAVSLVVSYRSGLKIALWHSLLMIATYEAQASGFLPGNVDGMAGRAVFYVTALWVVAIVTAVFSALNERELKRRRRDLEALADTASELQNVSAPRDVAGVLLQAVTESFSFRRGLVLGLRGESLTVLAASGTDLAGGTVAEKDAVVESAFGSRRPVLVRRLDAERDAWLQEVLPDATNVSVFPLVAEGGPIGALVLEREGLPRIERRMVVAVEQFAAHGALALRSAWLLEQVQQLAERDPLTGICNRRTFERELARTLTHSDRTGEPLTLAMFDIDHFKLHNDHFGHQHGDEVLRAVAAALTTASRAFDTVARYGGEEFAVIMPALAQSEAAAAVERLRDAIAMCTTDAEITASAGLATYPVNARDAESLIRTADEALYESKARGRDRSTKSRRRGGLRSTATVASSVG